MLLRNRSSCFEYVVPQGLELMKGFTVSLVFYVALLLANIPSKSPMRQNHLQQLKRVSANKEPLKSLATMIIQPSICLVACKERSHGILRSILGQEWTLNRCIEEEGFQRNMNPSHMFQWGMDGGLEVLVICSMYMGWCLVVLLLERPHLFYVLVASALWDPTGLLCSVKAFMDGCHMEVNHGGHPCATMARAMVYFSKVST
eukprot:Gb_01923 [translate_table: standard]